MEFCIFRHVFGNICGMDILFFDFTGVYEAEGFSDTGEHIDLRCLSGTGMYIDDEAERRIRQKIEGIGSLEDHRLRFLDNGNYHYMTRILASYVSEPFELITFDNHTDDKPPAFEGIRSCGSWRLDILRENQYLKTSMLIQKREDFAKAYISSDLPLYISIDKDILSENVLKTNWDQGDMGAEELFAMLDELYSARRIIAVDVCGEDLPDAPCEANRIFNKKMIRSMK